MIRERVEMVGKHLEIRAVVARRHEAEAFDLGSDVVRALHVPDAADLAALHGVVGELVEADLKVARGDGGSRRGGGDALGIAVFVEFRCGLRVRGERGKQSERHETGATHADSEFGGETHGT